MLGLSPVTNDGFHAIIASFPVFSSQEENEFLQISFCRKYNLLLCTPIYYVRKVTFTKKTFMIEFIIDLCFLFAIKTYTVHLS